MERGGSLLPTQQEGFDDGDDGETPGDGGCQEHGPAQAPEAAIQVGKPVAAINGELGRHKLLNHHIGWPGAICESILP
jgi:hypothetical protein